jgi:hypothetical protein
MSSSGLASRIRKSAIDPFAIVPVLAMRRNSAPFFVAATITCAGVIPAATMSSISTCGAHGVLPSVPSAIVTPHPTSSSGCDPWIAHVAAT